MIGSLVCKFIIECSINFKIDKQMMLVMDILIDIII